MCKDLRLESQSRGYNYMEVCFLTQIESSRGHSLLYPPLSTVTKPTSTASVMEAQHGFMGVASLKNPLISVAQGLCGA